MGVDNGSQRPKRDARHERLFILVAAAVLAACVGLAFYFAAPF